MDIDTNKLPKEEQLRRLQSWLKPKLVQIRELECKIAMQELLNKQVKENIENNFYIYQKEKEIAEQPNTTLKKVKELELERLKGDLKSGYYLKKSELELESLNVQLSLAKNALEQIKNQIKKLEKK